jgi:histidinol-phosphate/aromatic aminotransferase/cobyric acid decarboxylase-like protein
MTDALRITVGLAEDNRAVLEALAELLDAGAEPQAKGA